MILQPEILKKGDAIAIAAAARWVTPAEMEAAVTWIEKEGFTPVINPALFQQWHQLGGDDRHRIARLQACLDDEKIKAIWFARGGYGTARIIDYLDFKKFRRKPKWLLGFSDATVILNHIYSKFGIKSMHASLALQAQPDNSLYHPDDLELMKELLTGNPVTYHLPDHPLNRPGYVDAVLAGGNLSVLFSIIGTASFPPVKGHALFLEDLDEYLYHIDRMMLNLKRNGFLAKLSALLVGSFTEMHDNPIPFGATAQDIIAYYTQGFDYPVYFNLPSGHSIPNKPLIIGGRVLIRENQLILSA